MNVSGAGIAITGCGSAAPTPVLPNEGLSRTVETSDEWIQTRTGIQERRIAAPTDSIVSLSTEACRSALDMAGITPMDVDLILLATSTPDDLFGTACLIQGQLGASRATAFDITAACSGFVFGMVTAAQFLRTGVYQTILVVGADVLSRWCDWNDRRTCILFGDGAGAVVMQANDVNRFLGFELRSDGSQNEYLNLSYQSEPNPLVDDVTVNKGNFHPITMNGQEVYRFACRKVPEVIEKALYRSELTIEDVDWLVMHQANQRILDAVGDRLKLPREKIISNLAQYGNTSAASIPIALDQFVRSGTIQAGQTIASAGFGAGLSWGAVIFQWGR